MARPETPDQAVQNSLERKNREQLREIRKEGDKRVSEVITARVNFTEMFAYRREFKEMKQRIQWIARKNFDAFEKSSSGNPEIFRTKVNSFLERLDTSLVIYAGEDRKISSLEEIANFSNSYLAAMEFVMEKDPAFDLILEKVKKQEALTENEWARVMLEVETSMDSIQSLKEALSLRNRPALLLIKEMSLEMRTEFARRLLRNPGREQHIVMLTEVGFLELDQAEQVLKEAWHRDERKRDKEYVKALQTIQSAEFRNQVIKARRAYDQAEQALQGELRINYHSATSNLSVSGFLGNFAKLSGVLTIISNFLSNIKQPQNLLNPAMLFGIGMFLGGMELTGPEPLSQRTARFVKNIQAKAMEKEEKRNQVLEELEWSFGTEPRAAELAVAYYPDLQATYLKEKARLGTKPRLTLEKAGIAYERLPMEFQRVPRKLIEDQLTEWFYEVDHETTSLGSATVAELIQDTRQKKGLSPYPTQAPWMEAARFNNR